MHASLYCPSINAREVLGSQSSRRPVTGGRNEATIVETMVAMRVCISCALTIPLTTQVEEHGAA